MYYNENITIFIIINNETTLLQPDSFLLERRTKKISVGEKQIVLVKEVAKKLTQVRPWLK